MEQGNLRTLIIVIIVLFAVYIIVKGGCLTTGGERCHRKFYQ